MGSAHFVGRCAGNAAFKCDDGVLGSNSDRAGGAVPSSASGADGAFCRFVFENMFLPPWDCADFDGLHPADRQLLYFLSNNFSDESFLRVYIVLAQLPLRAAWNFMYAGLLMSTIFDLYSIAHHHSERNIIPDGQGFFAQFSTFSGDFHRYYGRMCPGKLCQPCYFKNYFKKFFLTKIKIWDRYYVNKPYLVFCYKNKNLRNIFVKKSI